MDMPRQVEKLKIAIKERDEDQARKMTHAVNGASRNVGAEKAVAILTNLSSTVKKEDWDRADVCFAEFVNEMDIVLEEANDYIDA